MRWLWTQTTRLALLQNCFGVMAMSEIVKPNIQAALAQVQSVMQVPKSSYNAFGKYPYRTAEAILRSAKSPCKEHGVILTLSEEVQNIGERYYIISTATATLIADPTQKVSVSTAAREPEHRSGSDDAQLTGSSISYARKYALCGLLAIDDGQADPDVTNKHIRDAAPAAEQTPHGAKICTECGKPITDMREGDWSRPADWVAAKSTSIYGKALCGSCFKAHRQAGKAQEK